MLRTKNLLAHHVHRFYFYQNVKKLGIPNQFRLLCKTKTLHIIIYMFSQLNRSYLQATQTPRNSDLSSYEKVFKRKKDTLKRQCVVICYIVYRIKKYKTKRKKNKFTETNRKIKKILSDLVSQLFYLSLRLKTGKKKFYRSRSISKSFYSSYVSLHQKKIATEC